MATRRERLEAEMATMEDAIINARSKGAKGLEPAEEHLARIRVAFEQGTWALAEKLVRQAARFKESDWYRGYAGVARVAKRSVDEGKPGRFEDDGLCGKYGHEMVKVKYSNVRWFYQCRWCRRKGRSASIRS